MALANCNLADPPEEVPGPRGLCRDLKRYLLNLVLVNAALWSLVVGLLDSLSMPYAVVWGATAGMVSLLPVAGPALAVAAMTLVSLIFLEYIALALLAPLAVALLQLLRYRLLDPLVAARLLTFHPGLVLPSGLALYLVLGPEGLLLTLPLLLLTRLVALQLARESVLLRRQVARMPR